MHLTINFTFTTISIINTGLFWLENGWYSFPLLLSFHHNLVLFCIENRFEVLKLELIQEI